MKRPLHGRRDKSYASAPRGKSGRSAEPLRRGGHLTRRGSEPINGLSRSEAAASGFGWSGGPPAHHSQSQMRDAGHVEGVARPRRSHGRRSVRSRRRPERVAIRTTLLVGPGYAALFVVLFDYPSLEVDRNDVAPTDDGHDVARADFLVEHGFEPEISLAVLPNTQSELPFGWASPTVAIASLI